MFTNALVNVIGIGCSLESNRRKKSDVKIDYTPGNLSKTKGFTKQRSVPCFTWMKGVLMATNINTVRGEGVWKDGITDAG